MYRYVPIWDNRNLGYTRSKEAIDILVFKDISGSLNLVQHATALLPSFGALRVLAPLAVGAAQAARMHDI